MQLQLICATVSLVMAAIVAPGCATPTPVTPVEKGTPTRIGTLGFENGLPNKDSVAQLYEESDFQRATQAYLWGLPLESMEEWRLANENVFGAKNGDIVIYESNRDKMGILTANPAVTYVVAFVNLKEMGGNVVVDLPAGANISTVLDFWQKPLTDMGQTGPDGGKGAKYLIMEPGMQSKRGYSVRATTDEVCLVFRSLETDRVLADAWVKKIRIYSVNDESNPPAQTFLTPGGKWWSQTPSRGMKYWEHLAAALDREPVQERDRVMMAMLKSLGIEKGKPFNPDWRQKKALEDGAYIGEQLARAGASDKTLEGARYRRDCNWQNVVFWNAFSEPENSRLLDEMASFSFEATMASKEMIATSTPGIGLATLAAYRDLTGHALEGAKSYHLHIPAHVPAANGWSLTAYDLESRRFIESDHGVVGRSSASDLLRNSDGSVDMYFGPKPPVGFEKNWIPTVPGRAWFVFLRLEGPLEGYLDQSWRLPDVQAVDLNLH